MIQSTVMLPYSGWLIDTARSTADRPSKSAAFSRLVAANAATASRPVTIVSRAIQSS